MSKKGKKKEQKIDFRGLLHGMGKTIIALARGVGDVVSKLVDNDKGKSISDEDLQAAVKETYGVDLAALLSSAEAALAEGNPADQAEKVKAAAQEESGKDDGASAEEEGAGEEVVKTYPIGECRITVEDVHYTGKKIKKPTVTVEFGDKVLKEGEDYSFSYDKKARDIGLYTLTVKGNGQFTGSAGVRFYVVPKAKTLIRMISGDSKASLNWESLKNIEGCQIRYSLNEDFSDSREEKIESAEEMSRFVENLKAGEKYYTRVRIYAADKEEAYYSAWSKVKILEL